jgi:hypothetical protein
MGRPRLKGEPLPNLAVVAEDPSTSWTPTTHCGRLVRWWGTHRGGGFGDRRLVHSTGLPAVPIRWVLVRDPQGAFATQALLLTDLGGRPEQILGWFVLRWQMDGDDFSASTAASRGRDAKAVVRAGNPADHPGVVGTVLARNPLCPPANLRQVCRASGGQRGIANPVRPSQMLWRWYARSYGHTRLFGARPESRTC